MVLGFIAALMLAPALLAAVPWSPTLFAWLGMGVSLLGMVWFVFWVTGQELDDAAGCEVDPRVLGDDGQQGHTGYDFERAAEPYDRGRFGRRIGVEKRVTDDDPSHRLTVTGMGHRGYGTLLRGGCGTHTKVLERGHQAGLESLDGG